MARKPEDTIETALCHLFPSDWLTESTRATGLVQRQRKVDPISLFWTLVLSFGLERRKNGLASLRHLDHYVGQSTHQTETTSVGGQQRGKGMSSRRNCLPAIAIKGRPLGGECYSFCQCKPKAGIKRSSPGY